MEINKSQIIGIMAGLAIMLVSLLFLNTDLFFFLIGIGVLVGVAPFVFSIILQNKLNNEKEDMFLEFARNLVESVKVGTPISKSIINIKGKSYGALSENVEKLANQISLGIPLHTALEIFSRDVNNKTISRSLTLIGEAERAGGNIGQILEEVTGAVKTSDKLKKERLSSISTLAVQGYIIFIIFMVIIIVMQFKILPLVSGLGGTTASSGAGLQGLIGISGIGGGTTSNQEVSIPFLYLLLVQGLFSGLTIGKLGEGNIKAGIKHSFALMVMSFLVSAGANLFLGGK
ncbi:MAG TPA: type II secretion system F family protein [Patescibacteria group bacterium]|nr:type II secretion system F family protein [Patescibacteria group bacterium]